MRIKIKNIWAHPDGVRQAGWIGDVDEETGIALVLSRQAEELEPLPVAPSPVKDLKIETAETKAPENTMFPPNRRRK